MPCIIDGNKVVLTPIREILDNLQQQLYISNIHKLDTVIYKQNNARVTCPVHKGGLENRPSCDILLNDKETFDGFDKKIIPAGTAHCFSCGYKASLVKFIANCLSVSYRQATEWLLGFVDYEVYTEPRDIGDFDLDSNKESNNYSQLPIITCDDLKKYDFYHPYMEKRRLTPEIIEKYEVGYFPDEDVLTFPVYVDGKCLFVAKRKVGYKKFIMPVVNPKPIYGLDYIENLNEIYITESIINTLTLSSYGLQAIALFGTGSNYQIKKLNDLNVRKYIICLDPDDAGINGRKRLIKNLKNKIVTYIDFPKGKDVNDLTKEEFFSLEEKF